MKTIDQEHCRPQSLPGFDLPKFAWPSVFLSVGLCVGCHTAAWSHLACCHCRDCKLGNPQFGALAFLNSMRKPPAPEMPMPLVLAAADLQGDPQPVC